MKANKLSRRVFLGVSAALTTVTASQLMTSCGNNRSTSTGSPTQGQVNLYSSRHYNTDTQLYEDFKQETGIQVNLVEGSADELIERISSEGANSPADILITVDVARLWRAQEAGIFAPVSSALLNEKIPPSLRQPDGLWFGFTKRARVIMYDKAKIKPANLSTYEDLSDPKWKGKILVRPSSNTYNQSLVAALIVEQGEAKAEEWCRGLVANLARPPQGNDVSNLEAIAAGIGGITLANTYYLARMASDPKTKQVYDKIGVFFPNQQERGAHVNISGGGLVKTSPNRENALKFLEFLVSDKAQEFLTQGNYEYPVVTGVALDPTLQSFGKFKADETNIAEFGPNLAAAVKVMDRAGWK